MEVGYITQYIDVAQVVLYVFWLFFVLLVLYLNRESRREGFPLRFYDSDRGAPNTDHKAPPPKTYNLLHGEQVQLPSGKNDDHRELNMTPMGPWPGAAFEANGNAMLDGLGAAAWAERADVPDMTSEGEPRIAPLSQLPDDEFYIAKRSMDPRGMDVRACDGKVVGKISDIMLDRMEFLPRYFEVTLNSGKSVMLPMMYMTYKRKAKAPRHGSFAERVTNPRQKEVRVASLNSEQFEQVPATANPSVITLLEEDKIQAYYGGAHVFGSKERQESLI
ncbi:MAG: PRC-barrel domain-containing protein [Granulosicoccus sp.]|nr:PRC-barrel domain-containing protein [Granulosicoccus sp.]